MTEAVIIHVLCITIRSNIIKDSFYDAICEFSMLKPCAFNIAGK